MTTETMLARDALWRDHARYHLADDQGQRNRIKGRMIDTVMDLVPVGHGQAEKIVDDLLRQDPSTASQLKIGDGS